MIPWLQALGQLSRLGAVRRFHARRDDPERAQREVLAEIVAGLEGTGFAQDHAVDRVRTLRDWQRVVPIQRPADHQAEVRRILAGERRRLMRDPVLAWAGTSGSGGTRKLYPLTQGYRRQYLRTVASFLWHLTADHPRAFDHSLLYLTGPAFEGRASDGVPLVSMSGYNASVQPGFVQRRYAAPVEAASITQGDRRAYVIARCALARRVSFAVSIMPSGLTHLVRTVGDHIEELARDLHDGTLKELEGLDDPALREALRPWLRPAPERAREVEAAVAQGPTLPGLWPDLRLISCWKAAAAGAFLPELRRLAAGVPIRDAIYSATEGWLNVPLDDELVGGPAASTSHLIEIVVDGEDRPRLLHELKPGQRGRVLVSTTGGCFRYDLGDRVEVTGRWGQTPTLVFVRKVGGASNLAGELLDASHVHDAATRAGADRPAAFYAVTADADAAPPRYHLYVEHSHPQAFGQAFEQALAAACVDYGPKCDDGALGALAVHTLPERSWDRLRELRASSGAIEAQLKPPVLTSDPAWRWALQAVAAPSP